VVLSIYIAILCIIQHFSKNDRWGQHFLTVDDYPEEFAPKAR